MLVFSCILPSIFLLRIYFIDQTKIFESIDFLCKEPFLTECDLFPISSLIIAVARVLAYLYGIKGNTTKEGNCAPFYLIILNHITIFFIQGLILVLLLIVFEKRILEKAVFKCIKGSLNKDNSILDLNQETPLLEQTNDSTQTDYNQREINKITNQHSKLTTVIKNLKKTYCVLWKEC